MCKKTWGTLVTARCAEEVVGHEQEFKGMDGQRRTYTCTHERCAGKLYRGYEFRRHLEKLNEDAHLQETSDVVLRRGKNFAPGEKWNTKEKRMNRTLDFIEQRHFLGLAREKRDETMRRRSPNRCTSTYD